MSLFTPDPAEVRIGPVLAFGPAQAEPPRYAVIEHPSAGPIPFPHFTAVVDTVERLIDERPWLLTIGPCHHPHAQGLPIIHVWADRAPEGRPRDMVFVCGVLTGPEAMAVQLRVALERRETFRPGPALALVPLPTCERLDA